MPNTNTQSLCNDI